MTSLTTAQRDRAAGVLLATAAGDALGAGYEFGPPLAADVPVTMTGGGSFGWAPGEWTDDTSMAIVIAQVAAIHTDLLSRDAQDRIASRWMSWAATAKDVGVQTRAVFRAARLASDANDWPMDSVYCRGAAEELHQRTGHTAGNGSLMRTAPVALAYLNDEAGLVQAAASISSLTRPRPRSDGQHQRRRVQGDPEAGEACVLWCLAIRSAVLTGELDVRRGLDRLPADRAEVWAARLDEAEAHPPAYFIRNGWAVHALQAAWSAIAGTTGTARAHPADHLRLALEAAVRGGRDTDTVAAIAGGLLGAAYGACAVPAQWRRVLHGWPGLRAGDLVALADAIATGEEPFDGDYAGDLDALTRHPHDDGMWIGGVGALRRLPAGVDTVVSLCRVAPHQVPAGVEHIEVRLIDDADPAKNPHLGFVLDDTVRLLEALSAEVRTVLLHCVQAQSRTPTVAALYGARCAGLTPATALVDVLRALPAARPNRRFAALFAEETR